MSEQRPRHVLVLTAKADTLHIYREPLLRAMLEAGHRVTAMAGDNDPNATEILKRRGVELVVVPMSRTGLNPFADIKATFALRAAIKKLKPDVFFAYHAKPITYGLLAAKLAGVPKRVVMVTGVGYSFTDGREATRFVSRTVATVIYRSLLRFANAVIFHNPDDLDNFITRHFIKPAAARRINGSGVDLTHFREAPLPSGPITFVLIARLIGDKGIREYVGAARIVRRTIPEARFLLVGPFDTNPAAISRAEVDTWVKEGLIEYKGAVADVRPSIAESHVFVLPSYREGTPKTALEAIAMARPVITTDVPGCREVVILHETGLLVEVRNEQAVAEAMLKCASGKLDLAAMGKAGHDFAVHKFDAQRVSEEVLRICGLLPADEEA